MTGFAWWALMAIFALYGLGTLASIIGMAYIEFTWRDEK